MGWLLVVMFYLIGCGFTQVSQTVISENEAWQISRSSSAYQDALTRVDDASAVRLNLERVSEEGYEFWIWEDMKTHAATLERLRVNLDGQIYRLDSAEAQWVQEK